MVAENPARETEMTEDTLVRPATVDDVSALVALLGEALGDLREVPAEGFGEGLAGRGDPEGEAVRFREALEDPDAAVLVAERGGEVVGFGLAAVETHGDDLLAAPFLTVDLLAVGRGHRRAGVGAAVLAGLEAWGRERGLTAADLAVFEGNEAARRLFTRSGYRALERRMAKRL